MNDPGSPFQGLFGDLLKLLAGSPGAGTAWFDSAQALAQSVATDNAPESNPDPLRRIELEELSRVAELHVADTTSLTVGSGSRPTTFIPVGRGVWALRTLDDWRPVLERIVAAQETSTTGPGTTPAEPGDIGHPDEEGLGELLGKFATTLGPILLGMQFGSAAGHLAKRTLGAYALPIPRPSVTTTGELPTVPENIDRFADDWSLPVDQVRLWVCIRDLTAHAVLSRPHLSVRISSLIDRVAADSSAAQQGLVARIAGEASDPASLQQLLTDPESLVADLVTPGLARTSADLVAVTTALEGYVDHVTALVAETLIGNTAPLVEAWYRHRTTGTDDAQGAGALFGLDLDRAQVDRGKAFVRGVVERAGQDGLNRLWDEESNLPTPAEIDAPGLWLARIDLPATGG
jgi:putative hydrolase